MIGEEPPPLPFPSLPTLKGKAKGILNAQRHPSSPDMEYNHYQPSPPGPKIKKINKKSCDSCKAKKIKCDNNVNPDEVCKRSSCQCKYHVSTPNSENSLSMDSNVKYKNLPANDSYENKHVPPVDIIPSTGVFRKPGLLSSGHFIGEISFCGGYVPSESQPSVIVEENSFPEIDPTPIQPPYITDDDQLYLINVYYDNLNPFFPILNKQDMLLQRELAMSTNGPSYLSPLFFYALYARAAHLEVHRKFTQYDHQTFHDLGDDCITYASALANCYRDKPRVSTILALVIMANHLEQTKLPENLSRSWMWAGDAFRLALDLGAHRSLISENNDRFGQLCIRSFWLAYITDCTISMTYGRPSATEEKVLDVTSPRRVTSDDDTTAEWIEGLNSLVSLSKIANRVIKFNYCPPPPFKIQGPVKRHNAFLASVDSWLIDVMHPNNEPDSPVPNPANVITEESVTMKRFNFQKKIFLYTNLILLHRPYVNDYVQSKNSTRPSYDICAYAAVIVTDIISNLESSELAYHSKSPMTAYALVMALRIHIMNASTESNYHKFNSATNFSRSIEALKKLPQCNVSSSLIHLTMADLSEQYKNRSILAQQRVEELKSELAQNELHETIMTMSGVILNPGSTENKRKERPGNSNDSGRQYSPEGNTTNSSNKFSVREYQPNNKKVKKHPNQPKTKTSRIEGNGKDKQKQKSRELVFPTNTTITTTTAVTATNNNIPNSAFISATLNAAGQQKQQRLEGGRSENFDFRQSHQAEGSRSRHFDIPFRQPESSQNQNFDIQQQSQAQARSVHLSHDISQPLLRPEEQNVISPLYPFNVSSQQPYLNAQPFLQSPQTYTSSSASPVINPVINSTYSDFENSTYSDFENNDARSYEFLNDPSFLSAIFDDDAGVNIDFAPVTNFANTHDPNSTNTIQQTFWDVRNENNMGVSITPASNQYTPSSNTNNVQ